MASKTIAQFAQECRGFPTDLRAASKQGVHNGALLMTTRIRKNVRAIVPDERLSGATSMRQRRKGGSTGARVSVGFNVRQTTDRTTALISARGPWPLIESDTPAHGIPKQATVRYRKDGSVARSRFKKRAPLNIPGVGYRASARHPGTKGQHPFAKGRDATERQVPKVVQREVSKALTKRFG